MAALKVSTMATSCISTKHPPPQWVRRISPAAPPTTAKARTQIVVAMTTKSSVVINRRGGGGVRGERMSVWWRDGWRVISCADFGWGGSHQKITNLAPPPSSSTFSSSSTATNNHHNKNTSHMEEERERDDDIKPPKLLTIPTILTLGRVAAIPLLVTTFYSNSSWATTVTTSIFIAAAITDWLDGYLARRMHLGTPFGAFLDPVADKLMVAATLVLLCTRPLEVGAFGEIPWLLPIPSIAIIGREITMSAVREWAASQNGKVLEAVAVNNLGKWKTASQMIALTILLATRDTSIVGANILVPAGVVLLYTSAGLAVWSLAVYMKKIWRVLLKL